MRELHAKKGGEGITIGEIAPGPGEGTIMEITYSTTMAGRSSEEPRADVVRRYGPATRQFAPAYFGGCAPRDTCDGRTNREPMLVYDDGGPIVAILSTRGGTTLKQHEDARFAAAVSADAGRPADVF